MTAPQPAGGFRVEVDGVAQAIVELEDALDELMQIRDQAIALSRVEAPSADPVSREAALALSSIATEGKGSFPAAIEQGVEHLSVIIDGLKAALPGYRAADRL